MDMDAYLLWTLNDGSSLSVINPQVAFSKTRVRNVVPLAAQATSFALHPSGDALYVTLGGGKGVAVVDTRRSLVAVNVACRRGADARGGGAERQDRLGGQRR